MSGEYPSDAYSTADATPQLNDAGIQVDTIGVLVPGPYCDEREPGNLDIPGNIANSIKMVMTGDGCAPIFFEPALAKFCEKNPDLVPVKSHAKYDGTMYVLNDGEGYDLAKGDMIYRAFTDACGNYPGDTVKAMGIQLKPTGLNQAQIQAKIEQGEIGEFLLRVHIWEGEGQLISMTGEEFLDVSAGMTVLMDKDFNIRDFQQLTAAAKQDGQLMIDGEQDDEASDTYASEGAPGGCDASGQPMTPQQLDGLMAIVMVFALARAFRAKFGVVFSWGAAAAVLSNIGKGRQSETPLIEEKSPDRA
ncbi:hypothetical protein HON58_03615 [Candidatus Peregrinibacteria bacterium]|jgi:hypothetical protein|nr:hypothetical protein [Candidatus Peregrinibacteria bacterium]